jgi:hypothetical protein
MQQQVVIPRQQGLNIKASGVGRGPNVHIGGFFRLRMVNVELQEKIRKRHPDWEHEKVVSLCQEHDTGWVENIVTDFARRRMLVSTWVTSDSDILIHEGTNLSNVRRTSIQSLYTTAQVSGSAQVRNPDTTSSDQNLMLFTWTVQFPSPGADRDIALVALVAVTGVTSLERSVHGIQAYTKLSTPVTQTTVQAADVQYRVTYQLGTP